MEHPLSSEENAAHLFTINSTLLKLIFTLNEDVDKVMEEALDEWLKKRMLTCPITKKVCQNINGQCNECIVSGTL